jgi:hypothetical protein
LHPAPTVSWSPSRCGLKVFGKKGECGWYVNNEYSKLRTWCKIHLGVDEATHEMIATMVTTNDVGDARYF